MAATTACGRSCREPMSKLFRRLMLEKLMAAHQAGRLQFLGSLAYLPDAKAFAAYLAPLSVRPETL